MLALVGVRSETLFGNKVVGFCGPVMTTAVAKENWILSLTRFAEIVTVMKGSSVNAAITVVVKVDPGEVPERAGRREGPEPGVIRCPPFRPPLCNGFFSPSIIPAARLI